MTEFSRECVACVVVGSETGVEYTESRECGVAVGRLSAAILQRVL